MRRRLFIECRPGSRREAPSSLLEARLFVCCYAARLSGMGAQRKTAGTAKNAAPTDCGRRRDQLGQFCLAGVQRRGARRPSSADLLRSDDHLRHARRPQSRARRHVHDGRLCRLGRLQLYGLLCPRRHRRLSVRDAGRCGDGAGCHPPLLFPPARGPTPGHFRSRHRVRGDCALFLRQPVEGGTGAARLSSGSPRSASCSIRPTGWRCSALSRWR